MLNRVPESEEVDELTANHDVPGSNLDDNPDHSHVLLPRRIEKREALQSHHRIRTISNGPTLQPKLIKSGHPTGYSLAQPRMRNLSVLGGRAKVPD